MATTPSNPDPEILALQLAQANDDIKDLRRTLATVAFILDTPRADLIKAATARMAELDMFRKALQRAKAATSIGDLSAAYNVLVAGLEGIKS